MKKSLIAALVMFVAIGIAGVAAAQESAPDQKSESSQPQKGGTDLNIEIEKNREPSRTETQGPQGERGEPGPQGPMGAPGPQGSAGSPGTLFGMNSTVAVFVGLALVLVVIVALVAASKNRE